MKKVFLALLAITTIVSCKKEESDTTRPIIESVKVNGIAANEHEFNAGETFTVEVQVSDNEALNQLKINIHAADDGHSHEGESGETFEANTGTWSESEIVNLSGTSSTKTATFQIPNSVAGHWHIEVQLIDKEGNEATEYVTLIHVSNTNLPVFDITTNPAVDNFEIALTAGNSFTINGTVSDPDGLIDLHIELENESSGEVFFEYEVPGVSGTSFTMPEVLVGPILQTGIYHLHLHAADGQGFVGEWAVDVHVE
ncbi:MAG: DUF4625 domain-containing protein [Flavobacteriales bacterium]